MALITIDDYYNIEFYNESLEALKNNGIDYKEYINIKDFKWYIDIDEKPIMVNYDEASNSDNRWLINKVQALKPNEEYLLKRRNDDTGKKAMLKYVENTPLKEARTSDYAVFFNARGKDQLEKISKEIPIKIWYFGKYYSNKFRVALCTNKMILNYIDPDQILLENNYKELGRFESELNYKVFVQKDKLRKYSETPYFINGKYNPVKVQGDRKGLDF